jgi:hypothetical protein
MIKSGADIRGLHLCMRLVLKAVDSVYKRHGYDTVVTSGLDGTHSAGSFHYYGFAVDFRTNHLPVEKIAVIVEDVTAALGEDYFVLFEGDHLHVDARHYVMRKGLI